MITAKEALTRLREGNKRFAAGVRSSESRPSRWRRRELIAGQEPFAIVLGCSDSRVPLEMVFDQGLGDLFTVCVAGNIASTSQIGSVEFAVEEIGTPLVIVLGHTLCGAVTAAVRDVLHATGHESPHLQSIVRRIRPCVESLLAADGRHDEDYLVEQAVRANALMSTNDLSSRSDLLTRKIQNNELVVVAAEYSLETGLVEFFDGVPDPE